MRSRSKYLISKILLDFFDVEKAHKHSPGRGVADSSYQEPIPFAAMSLLVLRGGAGQLTSRLGSGYQYHLVPPSSSCAIWGCFKLARIWRSRRKRERISPVAMPGRTSLIATRARYSRSARSAR